MCSQRKHRVDATPDKSMRAFGYDTSFVVLKAEVCMSEREIGGITHRLKVPSSTNFGVSRIAREMGKEIANVKKADDGSLWFQLQ